MPTLSKPTAVWFGDTQLTGSMPLYFERLGLTAQEANNRQAVQRAFFHTICTEPPQYKTPTRRLKSTYLPTGAGSHLLEDYGYNDTEQTYKFAWDDYKNGLWINWNAEYFPGLMRQFEHALTGTHYMQRWLSSYIGHEARWQWLVDTFDNPLITAPRPALNILGENDVLYDPDCVVFARPAIYEGGDDFTTQFYRVGVAPVKFRVHPRLYKLRQSVAKNPTFWDPTQGIAPASSGIKLKMKGRPIILIQWTGTKQLVRTDSTRPMVLGWARNNMLVNGGTISYSTTSLDLRTGGALGIGWDYIRNEYIHGPLWHEDSGARMTETGFVDWDSVTTEQELDFWFTLENGSFTGTGDVYVSVIYADDSYIV